MTDGMGFGLALEQWKPVVGWPGYKVSNLGRVLSFRRTKDHGSNGSEPRFKLIGGTIRPDGHVAVRLRGGPSRRSQTFLLRTIVLEAFVGVRIAGMVGAHIDGDPKNNTLSNLQWTSRADNCLDHRRRKKPRHFVLESDDIEPIWNRLLSGETTVSIAKDYGVLPGAISSLKCGKAWRHIVKHLPGYPLVEPPPSIEPVYIPEEFCDERVEIWRLIPGYSRYRVSNLGRVQTCVTKARGGNRAGWMMTDVWREKPVPIDPDGYLCFRGTSDEGKMGHLRVHRCVLTAFVCPRPVGLVACHYDGCKTNNRASNLRWDTLSSNQRDRYRHAAQR